MFGKGLYQEEEALLRDIIRSINKKLDYSAREGEGSRFILRLSFRGHEGEVVLNMEDLTAARTDIVKRHQIRQKIKARFDHLDRSRYGDDVLGLKPARLLRAAPRPEPSQQRGFGRTVRR
ncbi:MAG TPA: hypothetical protein VNN77_10830 [candidate division Zixibacteria bacterium]|nr:hypothetical protein [candidate division Zixibacteria bacterium]